ncbi:MAG: efflux RND transporter periplasmic adaptor subunit [Planctomycetales bacterium]
MKFFVRLFLILLIPVALGAALYKPAMDYWRKRNAPVWRTAAVEKGNIISVVNSTGTVKPKLQVSVGSFVSGPIIELNCEFNQEVKKDQILAKIDPMIYQAAVDRDQATLLNREADVLRAKAVLQQAINDEKRAIALRQEDPTFIAQAEMDKYKFARMSLDAQVKLSETAVKTAEATLRNSLANLNYTKIKAPVDGIVINRKIDPGQTLAAQFQTPELFIIAPDMRKEMHIHASVDEADIGWINIAQEKKYPVTFTVDAYPDKLFTGAIQEIRLNSTTVQNVVTYPVVVTTPNPDLKLLPGMTASLSFQVDHRDDVLKLPNAALRFYPTIRQVRTEDLPILEGQAKKRPGSRKEDTDPAESQFSATERSRLQKEKNRRYVWVADGDRVRAVEVLTGLTDNQFTEILKSDLKLGDELVVGIDVPSVNVR